MNNLPVLVGVLGSIGALGAQSAGVALTALTPLTVQVSDGVVGNLITVPAGPLAITGGALSSLPNAPSQFAGLDWGTSGNNQFLAVRLEHGVANPVGSATFFGRAGPHEYLVSFTSAIPRAARLTVSRELQLSTGASAPLLQIDFDNDGIIDITNPSTTQSTTLAVSFGPQPEQIRVVVDVTLGAETRVWDRLTLRLEPENDLVIAPVVATCSPPAILQPSLVQASFDDGGIDFVPFSAAPSVFVLALAPQPALLTLNGSLPCILLPSPDVVLPATGTLHLALPASVRPVTLFAQGVWLGPSTLLTSDGYAVQAN